MIHGSVGNQTQRLFAEPFPIDNVLIHHCRLELLLGSKVEDLDCPALGLERDDVLAPVHDGAVGIDWSPHDLIVVLQVNNDDLGLFVFIELLANADVVVRFEGLEIGKRVSARHPIGLNARSGPLTHDVKPMDAG